MRPRRVGQLLDVAVLHLVHLGRRVEQRPHVVAGRGRRWRAGGGSSGRHPRRCARRRRRRRSRRAGPAPSRCGSSAGSCRRGRRGSAARGGRGRRAPPGARRAGGRGRPGRRGRPGSCGRSRARRRRARPTLSSMPPGGDRRCASAPGCGWWRRSSRCIVMSRLPTGTSVPSTSAISAARRWASSTPRLGMPSRTRSSAPLLCSRISCAMRRRARDTSLAERTVRPVGSSGWPGGHGGVGARQDDADLLPCLTGQVVKGCRNAVPTLRGGRGRPRRRLAVRTGGTRSRAPAGA